VSVYYRPPSLRWQFLYRFVHDEDRNAAARMMAPWEEWLRAFHQWGPDYPVASVYRRLNATLADLMDCARDLAWIGLMEPARPSPEEKRWLPRCPEWGEEVAEVVRAINREMEGPPAVFDYPAVFRNPE
jgi:hypothetical protein